MRTQVLLGAALTIALAHSANADFYVVEDQSTHRCTIVSQEPMPGTMSRTVGDDSYKSQQEAENAMRSALACANSPTSGPGNTSPNTNAPTDGGARKCGTYLASWPCRR